MNSQKVVEQLRAREPLFHHRELVFSRESFDAETADDFWEVGAYGRSTPAIRFARKSYGDSPPSPRMPWSRKAGRRKTIVSANLPTTHICSPTCSEGRVG
jgi:hypothetical protein